mmetsp:Transcript_8288/g.37798  ORF Transcript_8288/g.37798 Transcript_8288/m.37798 type:complete len:214 (-) Transcript_8288:361-1002(-)
MRMSRRFPPRGVSSGNSRGTRRRPGEPAAARRLREPPSTRSSRASSTDARDSRERPTATTKSGTTPASRPRGPPVKLASESPRVSPSVSITPRSGRSPRLSACGSPISGIRASPGPWRPRRPRASLPPFSPRSSTPWSARAKGTTAPGDWTTTRVSSRSRRRGETGRSSPGTTSTTRVWSWWCDCRRRTRWRRRSWTARNGSEYRRRDCASGC